jgi:predicted acetyltransferase
MDIDLSRTEIRPPEGRELRALYHYLLSIFPRENWLFQAAADGEDLLYSWSPTCMFYEGQFLGNVSRLDVNIWLAGAAQRVAGIASVATRTEFRRMGVAKHLLRAVLEQIDREGLDSVLFTKQPGMYASLGFRGLEQSYMMVSAGMIRPGRRDLRVEYLSVLDASLLDRIDFVYSECYPDYDGKVIRDRRYWSFYRGYFNHAPQKRIVLCSRKNVDVGYIRIEQEADRILVSEFCCQPERDRITEQLYGLIEETALSVGFETIAIALAEEHFLWNWLRKHGAVPQSETGAVREVFMVRGQRGEWLSKLETRRWPLSDKF